MTDPKTFMTYMLSATLLMFVAAALTEPAKSMRIARITRNAALAVAGIAILLGSLYS